VRRWLLDNVESLFFAFLLALSIWMAGVSAADPIEERVFPASIAIHYTEPGSGLLVVGSPPKDARVTVRAPVSVWQGLTSADIRLDADLTSVPAGTQPVPLAATIDRKGSRITHVDPGTVPVTLEEAASAAVPVRAQISGDPASRYRVGVPEVSPTEVQAIGPSSLLARVAEAVAPVDLTNAEESVDTKVTLVPRNASGQTVQGVTLDPPTADVRVDVSLPGGFRSVAVLPQVTDQVEPGYRVTNVEVTPPTVVVFSSDPAAVESLPGFVQTEPISLAGATQSIAQRVSVQLPEGVSLVDAQAVLVQVTIEPIQSSINVSRPVEVVGLSQGLYAQPSPDTVSVLLDGPLPALESLTPADVRVVVDLLGLGVGNHAVTAEVIVLPQGITVHTVLPDTIEVTISRVPFATPTPLP
jgi:YbbR domain-containing protein